jgi:hypothetical protein
MREVRQRRSDGRKRTLLEALPSLSAVSDHKLKNAPAAKSNRSKPKKNFRGAGQNDAGI